MTDRRTPEAQAVLDAAQMKGEIVREFNKWEPGENWKGSDARSAMLASFDDAELLAELARRLSARR